MANWLTGAGNALSGFVNVGERFGSTLLSAGSKAITSTPEFLGNVVAKAKTLVPFNLAGSTQPTSNFNPTISKSPQNPFVSFLSNFKSAGFIGAGANTAKNVVLTTTRPTGLTGAVNALSGFLNQTTSAINSVGALKSAIGTVFGGAGGVRDSSTGNLPSNFLFNLPADLFKALGGQSGPAIIPSGYVSLPDPSGSLAVPAGAGISAGVTVPQNTILLIGGAALLFLLLRKAR